MSASGKDLNDSKAKAAAAEQQKNEPGAAGTPMSTGSSGSSNGSWSATPMSLASLNSPAPGGALSPTPGSSNSDGKVVAPGSERGRYSRLVAGSPLGLGLTPSPGSHPVPVLNLGNYAGRRSSTDAGIATAEGNATPKPNSAAVAAAHAALAPTPKIQTPTPTSATPKPKTNNWMDVYTNVIAKTSAIDLKSIQDSKAQAIKEIQAANPDLKLVPVSMARGVVTNNDFVREPNGLRAHYKSHMSKAYPLALFVFKADDKYYIVNRSCTNALLEKANVKDFPIDIAKTFPHNKAVLADGDFCWSATGAPSLAAPNQLVCDHELLLQIKLNGQNLHSAVTLFTPGVSGAGEMTFKNGKLTSANSESGSFTLYDEQNMPALKVFFPAAEIDQVFHRTRAAPTAVANVAASPNGGTATAAADAEANKPAGATQTPSVTQTGQTLFSVAPGGTGQTANANAAGSQPVVVAAAPKQNGK